MSVSIDVTIDLSALEGKFDKQAAVNAQKLLAERIEQDCFELVPKKVGHLRDSRDIGDEGEYVAWTEEYAKYVYNMEDANWTTTGTCGHWFEAAKSQHLHDWETVVKEAFE